MKKAVLLCAALLTVVSCGKSKPHKKPRQYDYGVSKNLRYTGTIMVDSYSDDIEFTRTLLEEFNQYTNSSVEFQVVESQSIQAYISPTNMPDVLIVDSNNILECLKFGAISSIGDNDALWLEKYNDETIQGESSYYNSYRGYPYSITPTLMIYNKSLANPDDINTVDKLFSVAEEKNINVITQLTTHPFYANGVLRTFNDGDNFYQITPTSSTTYSATSSYNCDDGINGAKLLRKIIKEARYTESDSRTQDRLATFVFPLEAKRVLNSLGENYGVTALPMVDETSDRRIGSSTIVDLYCVNTTKSQQTKTIANDVAKFLASEYSQLERFKYDGSIPSVKTLEKETKNGIYVKAYNEQKAANSIRTIGVVESVFWNGIATACNSINNYPNINDNIYHEILNNLDTYLRN